MKCAVITPIGPGHEAVSQDCLASVSAAQTHSTGPFESVVHFTVDDTAGQIGRSAARNSAIARAAADGTDWLFFLDADDLLVPEAFERVTPLILDHDAIWGAICEQRFGTQEIVMRKNQSAPIRHIVDLLMMDPYYSLQMGHFVRTEVALQSPFATQLNAGEDFDYYLRVWLNHRCTKIAAPLFINRRGCHSQGPRSANGYEWRRNVLQVMLSFVGAHQAAIEAATKQCAS